MMDHRCPALAETSRRAFLSALGVGAAAVLAGCATSDAPVGGAPGVATTTRPPVPAPRPGPSQVLHHGPADAGNRIALTVDDGTCADCVSGYVEFARTSGTHLTFSPNGTYDHQWRPHAPVLAPLIAAGQVQIMNHTFTHPKLTTLSEAKIREELERNDEWVVKVFGVTTRPYYRPPYGLHNPTVDGVAGSVGYTRSVLWDGSYSDSTVITAEFLMDQARKYLHPGVIMLGHANHPAVLGVFDQILALIHERALEPVTLDELFHTSREHGA